MMKQPIESIKDVRMKRDFREFLEADTAKAQNAVVDRYNDWFASLSADEQRAVLESRKESMRSFLSEAKANMEKLDAAIIRKKLGDMPDALSMSYIAKNYFGKTSTWLYQRINGNNVNGKKAGFTSEEALQLQDALHDLGRRLSTIVLV